MNKKLLLYDRLKNFAYSTDLKSLNVFSRQYLDYIIKPYFSHNTDKDNYAIIGIDYNNLNSVNNLYGFQTGNKIIYNSIFLIQSVLPKNSVCCRYGGDEFLFIINNCNFENIEELIIKINSILKENENKLLGASVTSYGVHCSEKESLSSMIDEIDLKITNIKNNFINDTSYSKWGTLEKKLMQNLNSFFKSLRLYDQTIDIEFLKTLYTHAISSSFILLENNFHKKPSKYLSTTPSLPIKKNDLGKIYKLMITSNPKEKQIDEIDYSLYSFLLDKLTHDTITDNLSKSYFKNYLLDELHGEYKVKYISTAFVKLYNSIFSHAETDIKINEMINNFVEYLNNNQNISIENKPFCNENSNYLISLGAGDFLLAIPKNFSVDNDRY